MKSITEAQLNDYLTLRDQRVNARFLAGRVFRGVVQKVNAVYPPTGIQYVSVTRTGESTPDLAQYACALPGYVPMVGDVLDLFYRTKDEATVLQCVSSPNRRILLSTAKSAFDFNIPPGGSHLILEVQARSDQNVGAQECGIQFNLDSAAGRYAWTRTLANSGVITNQDGGATAGSVARINIPGIGTAAGHPGQWRFTILNYSGSTFAKTVRVEGGYYFGATFPLANATNWDNVYGTWAGAVPVTQIHFFPAVGLFIAGSFATLTIVP